MLPVSIVTIADVSQSGYLSGYAVNTVLNTAAIYTNQVDSPAGIALRGASVRIWESEGNVVVSLTSTSRRRFTLRMGKAPGSKPIGANEPHNIYPNLILNGNSVAALVTAMRYLDRHETYSTNLAQERANGDFRVSEVDRGTKILVNISFAGTPPRPGSVEGNCGPLARSYYIDKATLSVTQIKSVCF